MTAPTLAQGLRRSDAWAAQSFVTRLRRTIQALDVAVVFLAVALGLALGWGAGAPLPMDAPREFLALGLLLLWPAVLWQQQSTATTILGQGVEEYRRVLMASVWTATILAGLAYLTDNPRARVFLIGTVAVGTALLLTERHVMRLRLHRLMAQGQPLHRVFVIAALTRQGSILAALGGTDARFRIVGHWHLTGGGDPDPTVIIEHARALHADTIVYAPLGTGDTHWTQQLGWAMEESDLSLLVSPSLVEIAGPRLRVEPVAGLAFIRVDMPRFSGHARVAKRALDIIGASLGLLLLGIPMLVIAALIRRDSPGGAIFKQTRACVRSQTFRCWKFRTMYTGADAQRAALRAAQEAEAAEGADSTAGCATFKMAHDPRITKTGKWLRKFSIDELPQLVNVLKGEMSLVGPRPHPMDDVDRYDDVATRRLLAKPGMTGLWQVSGRSDLDWEQAVRLDLYYVENWSLAVDLLILLRTVKVVVVGSGAY